MLRPSALADPGTTAAMPGSSLPLSGPAEVAPARRSAPPARFAAGLVAAGMLAAAAWQIRTSSGRMLWLDDLYTTTLIDAPSLGHVLDTALRGVDGNPPLYLSLAWALTRAIRLAPEAVLRPFNLVLLAATAVLVYRIGRRVAQVAASMTLKATPATPATDGPISIAEPGTRAPCAGDGAEMSGTGCGFQAAMSLSNSRANDTRI